MMASPEAQGADCPVLVLDDGELDDVRALLHDLNVDYATAPVGSGAAADLRLLIATPRYAVGPGAEAVVSSYVAARRIAIWDGGARTLRAQLERSGCDFVVDRPIHPAALRLLVLHALYEGPEQRRRPRVAMGDPVKLKSGLRTRSAVLVQLSARGAGLLASSSPAVGDEMKLVLPAAVTGSGSQSLSARVVSVGAAGAHGEGTEFSVVFPGISSATQSILVQIMRSRPRIESAPNRSSGGGTSPRETGAPARVEPPVGGRARSSPRKKYQRAVLATGQGESRPLLGRDVSVGGMRVAPTSSLRLGDEFTLAVYGPPGVKPVMVKAQATRDDGEGGWVLQFVGLSRERGEALENLVRSLPVLASPLRGDEGLSPVVVSEIVEKSA